ERVTSTVIGFFFQAEDGIRDPLVTGVQTCALPIWLGAPPSPPVEERSVAALPPASPAPPAAQGPPPLDLQGLLRATPRTIDRREIGRASCRGGGSCSVGGDATQDSSAADEQNEAEV